MKEKISFLIVGILLGGIIASLIVGVNAVCPSAGGAASQKKILKLAHGLEATHPVHIGMLELKKEVEKLSGGKLSIDIYSGGVLGSETQCLEQLRNGSLDMSKASTAQLGTFVPKMYMLTLPYLYRDRNHYWKVLDSDIGKKFYDFMKSEGFIGLCYYDAGARSFYTTKKKIEKPEDLIGMKIRVMSSRSDMEMISAFGAAPTPVSAGETYTSLAQGLVDGAENNLPTYLTSAHYEVCKYFSIDEHTRIPDVLIVGEKAWNSLSDDEKKMLRAAAEKSSIFQRDIWNKTDIDAVDKLKAKGVVFTTPDKELFRAKTTKIYEAYTGDDAKIIDAIRNTK